MSTVAGGELSPKAIIKELLSYKSGLLGVGILTVLTILSIYVVIAIPYHKAIEMWRGSEKYWIDVPRHAQPTWVKYFIGKNLPETIIVDTRKGPTIGIYKSISKIHGTDFKQVEIVLSFKYNYDDFPSEVNLFFYARNYTSPPLVKIYWEKPDGKRILLKSYAIKKPDAILFITIDEEVCKALENFMYSVVKKDIKEYIPPQAIMFAVDDESMASMKTIKVLKSGNKRYKLIIKGIMQGENADIDAKLVVYGKVYGWAGTDHLRRDIGLALLWGIPVAISFGLAASLITSILQLIIATISGYYGGKIDSIIQRITEIYMIIPFLPFLIIISAFYKIDIVILLIVVIILSIFGGGIKSTRALVMQIKSYPYIEAAKAYGASDLRIILLYIIPKILPPLIPGLIGAVPGFVFLEAGLSFLGLGDPYLPTWGKVINDAYTNGAMYKGYWWWLTLPSLMLVITSIAFALIGFALDKIVNPKLREL